MSQVTLKTNNADCLGTKYVLQWFSTFSEAEAFVAILIANRTHERAECVLEAFPRPREGMGFLGAPSQLGV